MNKELANNTNLSHYRIVKKIGAGGMGEVYLAEDTKLDRRVALKILPAEFAEDKDRMSRFVREAKSASALNHPNIITIHEIGESDGTHFIATEFIDGKTLGDYAKSNRLNYKSALEIAVQVVSALDEAHAAGIVHRDIKPENIMVRASGLAKILDFGVAKLSAPTVTGEEAATAIQSQTQAGMIIGTPNYMSPEQARGQVVDQQTDIFSFGVVLHEMLSGASPFAGDTVGDVIAAVLMKEARRLENIPPELAAIVQKTLQKDKRNRYQSAKDLLNDLREVKQELEFQDKLKRTTGSGDSEPKTQILHAVSTAENDQRSAIQNLKSIVVLPFSNIGADAEDDYFSDGLTEEIISDLSNIKSLRVISRNSAMKLKGAGKDLKTITEELNVRYVLDGSVRKAGNKLRISVQLIDGATDANLWAEKYTGSLDDIFEIQESVSRSIADALKITLTTGEIEQIEERPIADAQAYDIYLRSRAKFMQGDPAALDRSIELLKQGLDLIGDNELLFATLGYTYYFYFRWISKIDENYLRLANECMEKTFAINPESSHGFSLKGHLSYSEGDIAESIRSLKKAVELQPGNTEALLWLSVNSAYVGKIEDSIKYADKLYQRDPVSSTNTFITGIGYAYQGEFSKALITAYRALEMNPASPLEIWSVVILEAWDGKFDKATAFADRLAELAPGWVYTEQALFLKHALLGEKELALEHYTPDFDKEAKYDCHFALHIAHCFALIGEKEKALDFLTLSVRNGMLNYSFLDKFDSLLENIRNEKRFKDLIIEAKRLFGEIYPNTNPESQKTLISGETATPEEPKTQILQAATTSKTGNGSSIAVLPFANMSADEENEYFCDGLAEELLNALSKIEELKVAARTSAFSFKGKTANISEIGEKLGVKNILEGSVRRSGNRLRISVQLVNASDGYQIWSERYDREMRDIFELQDEITLSVIDALKLKLFGDEKAEILKRYTDDAEVHELFLKGRYHSYKYSATGWQRAIEFFTKAIEKQPDFAPAHAGLAACYCYLWFFGFLPAEEMVVQSKQATARALELDENLAEAYLSQAMVTYCYDWQWEKSEQEFKHSIRLNPNYAEALSHYAVFLSVAERFDEAVAQGKHALEIDPLAPLININVGWTYFSFGLSNEALKLADKMIEIEPDLFGAYWLKGAIRLSEGEYEAAARELKKAVSLGGRQIVLSDLASAYALAGDTDKAAAILEQLLEMREQEYVPAICLARVYSRLGETDKTIEWLEKAFEERNGEMVFLKGEIEGAAEGDALRILAADPRLIEILNKMNLP